MSVALASSRMDPIDFRSLEIGRLERGYADGTVSPEDVIDAVYARIAEARDSHIWILVRDREDVKADLAHARRRLEAGETLALFGIPFAIKDNIDVAGLPTTAACPAASYVPSTSARVVERLVQAGALLIGKTNLDQFATGLVGTRSPYGVCRNAFDADYVSGGSSSGSAVAVALGQVSFALGTDTAGSGRVPAAFNNVVGLKPSVGLWSTRGVLPACRTIDCVSVFTLSCGDARRIHELLDAFDPEEPFSRTERERRHFVSDPARRFRFGVPRPDQRNFYGDVEYQRLYAAALDALDALGGTRVEIDCAPLFAAGRLLYGGAFVAERWASVGRFIEENPDAVDPTVRAILSGAQSFSAGQAFESLYALQEFRRQARAEIEKVDFLAFPTTGTIPTVEAVAAEPILRNAELGLYTTFVNLLDLCAVAVPAGFRVDGLPFGMTFIAPPLLEEDLLIVADRFHSTQGLLAGATADRLEEASALNGVRLPADWVEVAVVGAHLEGQPLNFQLTKQGARLSRSARTSAEYRLYALPDTVPPKPGLVRAPQGGMPIEVEVWAMPRAAFGAFVAKIPPPLGIGTLALDDGTEVKGFLAEAHAVTDAEDISHHGGWRAYLSAARSQQQAVGGSSP